jgi:hypothetical protein
MCDDRPRGVVRVRQWWPGATIAQRSGPSAGARRWGLGLATHETCPVATQGTLTERHTRKVVPGMAAGMQARPRGLGLGAFWRARPCPGQWRSVLPRAHAKHTARRPQWPATRCRDSEAVVAKETAPASAPLGPSEAVICVPVATQARSLNVTHPQVGGDTTQRTGRA